MNKQPNALQCAIDFEYKHPSDPGMGLISCALSTNDGSPVESFWLWDGSDTPKLKARLVELSNHTMIGYNIQQAEARCFAALGFDPNDWKWRDLMLEWRWLRNGDDRFAYGHSMQNGFPKFTVPPQARVGKKASQEEIDEANAVNNDMLTALQESLGDDETTVALGEVGYSLLDCLFFIEQINVGEYRDAESIKKKVRDGIIVAGPKEEIATHKDEILEYNAGDLNCMHALAGTITEKMIEVGEENHLTVSDGKVEMINLSVDEIGAVQLAMGDWAARLAKYAYRGIPLSRKRLEKLIEIVPQLKDEAWMSWNKEHVDTPMYRVGLTSDLLEMKKGPLKESPYIGMNVTKDSSMIEHLIDVFCESAGLESWPRTRSGKYDTSKKVIDRHAAGENLLKQYQRHQGHLSALNTFGANKHGRVEALDYIGIDDKQRPDFSPYGTQTARNGAKAKSYCFLGPHWLRMLVEPEEDEAIIDLDFGSQEVFIAGALSNDQNLVDAYASNDTYVYYAQLTGMYPKELPIPTEEQRSEDWFKPYKKIRNIAKTLNLSMQFGAGAKSVAAAVRDATKDSSIGEEQGADWVAEYRATYFDYTTVFADLRKRYKPYGENGIGIMLKSGWRMGPDNPSPLSAGNLPVQGTGSDILRLACKMMDEVGIKIIATLHDAITISCKKTEAEAVAQKASDIMKKASEIVIGRSGMKVGKPEIVKKGHIWIHSERAEAAWSKFGKHFSGL